MKDSNNNMMDKQLADKGWAGMQTLLDREMPVERKRRRGIVWMYQLAAALLLPVLGVGAWHLFAEQGVAPKETIIVADNNPHNFSTENQASTTHHGASTLNEAIPETSPDKSVSNQVTEEQKATYKPEKAANHTSKSRIPESGMTFQNNAGSIQTPPSNTNDQQLQVSTPGMPAHNNDFPTLQQPESRVSTLYPRPVVFPNTLGMPYAEASIEPQNVKAPQAPWAFGAGAGIQTATDMSGLNGAVAGLSVDYKVYRQLGMRSGLNYQAFQPDNSERPIVSISAATYTEATGFEDFNPANIGTTAADMQVDVPLARVHRVEAPLLAYWQPWSVLRLFGGVRVGYNVYAQAAQRAQTEFGAFDTPASGEKAHALNKNVTETLPNWDPSWSGGLGIGLGKHAEIGLFYNHPWKSASNTDTNASILSGPAFNAGNAKPGATNAPSFQFSATVFF